MGHAGDADELLEILGDELGAIVADDAWPRGGETGTLSMRCRLRMAIFS
jgi:hypothetical protein